MNKVDYEQVLRNLESVSDLNIKIQTNENEIKRFQKLLEDLTVKSDLENNIKNDVINTETLALIIRANELNQLIRLLNIEKNNSLYEKAKILKENEEILSRLERSDSLDKFKRILAIKLDTFSKGV